MHAETAQVENINNNDYKQLKLQETKWEKPTLHTYMRAHTCTHARRREFASKHAHTHAIENLPAIVGFKQMGL